MFKFFRKIRFELLNKNKTSNYFKYAIGEIFLVVIGILIALQINNWNEHRKLKQSEKDYLNSFINDLQADISNINIHQGITKFNKIAAENVVTIFNSNGNFEQLELQELENKIQGDTLTFLLSISRTGFIWYPNVTDFTITDLKSSGNINIVSNRDLKKDIFNYYSNLEKYNDWKAQKNEAQRIYQNIQSFILDPTLRIMSNMSTTNRDQLLADHIIDINTIISKIKAIPEIEAAANGMIYTQDRLLFESNSRIKNAEDLIIKIQKELKQ